MKNSRQFYIRFVFSIVALLVSIGNAQAQNLPSVGITPAIIDAKVKRGASYTQDFVITNSTGARMRFRASAEDIWYNEDNKRLTGRAGTLPRSASLWTQFFPSEIVVEPYSSATIKTVVTIPQSVSGSFYTVPVFAGMPADKPVNAQISTASATIGVKFRGLMMLTTDEGSEYNVEIISGKINAPTASSEMEIALDVKNRGTAHAKIRGAFAVLDASGKLAGRGEIKEKTYLPTQRKNLDGKWSGELPPGNYTCVLTLSFNRVRLEPSSLIYEIPFTVKPRL